MSLLKALTDSGRALADIYRTKGGTAGINRLDTSSVVLTHEMGKEIAAERLAYEDVFGQATSVNQSTAFNFSITVPFDLFRIENINVVTATGEAAKFDDIVISTDNYNSVMQPFWAWNSATGTSMNAVLKLAYGGSTTARDMYLPVWYNFPGVLPGRRDFQAADDKRRVRLIEVRGTTAAFGAGTASLFVHVLYTHMSGLINDSERNPLSRGLPWPS